MKTPVTAEAMENKIYLVRGQNHRSFPPGNHDHAEPAVAAACEEQALQTTRVHVPDRHLAQPKVPSSGRCRFSRLLTENRSYAVAEGCKPHRFVRISK